MKFLWTYKFMAVMMTIGAVLIILPMSQEKAQSPMWGPGVKMYRYQAPQQNILESPWIKLVGQVCGIIGAVGGAVKILVSFLKAIWKCGAFVCKRRRVLKIREANKEGDDDEPSNSSLQ